ncbi:hypothetical protein [Campylobacter upsaliensis]|uniref:hypothetical protein n=1 Tax=Campylobacter upsaliensis TaxID=28080 RepID=UPI00214A6C92|nr:hypothetical protein [Campylobacter upsaliensis]MCR2110918.1 hypothetical protein [Campylobacter upsaliensis]
MNYETHKEIKQLTNENNKIKKKRTCFYLNQFDFQKLNEICKEQKTNKSSFLRKIIVGYQYLNLIKEIENYNKNIQELSYQIKRCGINLNQIVYHLRIDINEEEVVLSKTQELFFNFKKLFEEHEKILQPIILDLKKTQRGEDNE